MVFGALGLLLTVLVVATVVTRRRPTSPVPDLDDYLVRWSAAHDGYDAAATRFVGGWLKGVYRLARPFARAGVLPNAVTAWTAWLALVVVALTGQGGGWAVVAGVLLVASGLGDALDGAVAVLTGRETAWGYVLDSVVDRINDVLYVVAAWIAGAPAWLAIACGTAFGLLEYMRARAGNAGADHTTVITVGERPQRIICCAIAVGLSGMLPARAADVARHALIVLLVLSVTGLVQLAFALHRQLRGDSRQ
jgi:CDP-diacylglycerol--glycerol-3-phosphate 3-phosphatidyltransferase